MATLDDARDCLENAHKQIERIIPTTAGDALPIKMALENLWSALNILHSRAEAEETYQAEQNERR